LPPAPDLPKLKTISKALRRGKTVEVFIEVQADAGTDSSTTQIAFTVYG
jgi:hypothetical protein